MKKQLLSIIIALTGATTSVYAQQPGSLDATFNGKGIKNFAFVSTLLTEQVTASYLQPDGKLLVAMNASAGNTGDTVSYIVRFMPDGKEDVSFGTGGRKELDANFLFGNTSYFVSYAIALQSDGTIILGGTRRNYDYDYACIVSLNPDGSFNESFANGLSCVVLGEAGNMIRSLQIHQKTGNIWACGGSPTYGSSMFFTCALTRTGQTFMGDGGIISGNYFPDTYNYEYATSSVMKGDILYMGGTVRSFDNQKHLGIMAINVTTGNKVNKFFDNGEGGGAVIFSAPPEFSNTYNEGTTLCFTPDSLSLFIGGYSVDLDDATNVKFVVAKVGLKNGGYIDQTFSDDGMKIYHINGSSQNYLRAMVIDPSGRMLLAGTVNSEVDRWTLLRVLPNGNVDKTFGASGEKIYDGNNGNRIIESPYPIGVHYNKTSKKYVLTGYAYNPVTSFVAGLVKQITYKGEADNSFGASSERIIANGKEESALVRNIAVRSDGKMIIGGPSQDADDGNHFLAMLNEDGSQDKTFGAINLSAFVSNLLFLSKGITTSAVKITDIKVQSDNNKILVAGHYVDASLDGNYDMFILRLNPDGTLDAKFNGSGCYNTQHSSGLDYKTQGITLRSDGGIVWYGYFYNYFQDETSYYHALMQFNANGARNEEFNANSGIYIYTEPVSSVDDFSKSMDVIVRSDNKIIVASSASNTDGNEDFLVFRLSSLGVLDTDFGTSGDGKVMVDYGYMADQTTASVALTSDNRIVVGGRTHDEGSDDNLLLMLTEKGEKDVTFGNGGLAPLNRASGTEGIGYVTVKDNKIIATGYKFVFDEGLGGDRSYLSVMRFTLAGLLDNTFIDRGYTVIKDAYILASVVANNKLYFAGSDRKLEGTTVFKGLTGRVVLGSGPVIKVTNLQAVSYNKFLGDAPFLLAPVSNSPGAKQYSVSSTGAGCVAVDASTGLVTMNCATVNSGPVVIRVIQPVTSGFTADTAYSTINVGKGIPKIIFNPQGDTLTSTITLIASSDSDKETYANFYLNGGDDVLSMNGDGTAYIYAIGCANVQVYYNETANYLSGYASTTVCGHLGLIPPTAYNDNITLIYPPEKTTFNPLTNDEAHTGTIKITGIDLDPSTPGIQRTFDSPALGTFEVDTINNVIIYTPFTAFIGKGLISYAVYDSKETRSNVAEFVIDLPQSKVPDLRATELFTPNNDGLNDAFVIGYTILSRKNKLTIFDRNGAELFTRSDYANDWKGELANGKQAENGIYYYTYTEGGDGDEVRELKGSVELRR